MITILGINCYGHDTSAALLVDGRITQFHEEERFSRKKHTNLYPFHAVIFCLNMAGGAKAIDHIAYPFDVSDEMAQRITEKAQELDTMLTVWYGWANELQEKIRRELRYPHARFSLAAPAHQIGHHEAHMASTFYSSPFERAAVLSLDGVGDLTTTMFGIGEETKLRVLKTIEHPHGIGYLYQNITQHLGFIPSYDEGKTMGLAPYGRPRLAKEFSQLAQLAPEGEVRLNLDYMWHHTTVYEMNPKMAELLGPPRGRNQPFAEHHEDIAYGAQEFAARALIHHVKYLYEQTKCENLCLSGGVALNSCANAKVLANTPFRNIFIPPFVNDGGLSIGAAQWVYHNVLGHPRVEHRNLAYLGFEPGTGEIERAILEAGLIAEQSTEPWRVAAEMIAAGKIVGWYQRRSEAGPRALGNRSILADPRRAEMKDTLNARVKFREGFRPFAPAILEERVSEYFEHDRPEPYMLQVKPIRPETRSVIPAVTHVDGTGRLQTVGEHDNPLFYHLLTELDKLTGVPVVLNTSFNVMGEPIVNKPAEAIACYLKTGMDALVLGNYILRK